MPRKKTEALTKAIKKNTEKAADKEKQRLANIDRMWGIYAKALVADDLTKDEETELPGILARLNISPEQAAADAANLDKVRKYEAIVAEQPPKLDELRAKCRDFLQQYEQCRRQLKTAGSYEVRRREMQLRIDAIKHARAPLWCHLDALLPPVEPGVEPPPRAGNRIIPLLLRQRPSQPVADDDGDPEPLKLVETVADVPVAIDESQASEANPGGRPVWPRPIAAAKPSGEIAVAGG